MDDFITSLEAINIQLGQASISLIDVFRLIFPFVIVFFFVKYFGNFLKYYGLKKMVLHKDIRYAIATFISYSIGFFLLIILFQSMGFDVSVLVVITVTLIIGFVSVFHDFIRNFVSGVMLISEHKINLGDYIQVGDLKGFVQEISYRTIVLRQKDSSSVILPSSRLAENQVTNFCYETNIARLKFPLVFAHGSDTTLVTETLLVAAYGEYDVLKEPSPQVIFQDFEEHGLLFELWIWIDNAKLAIQEEILSSLCFALEHQFRLNHIEIPVANNDFLMERIRNVSDDHGDPDAKSHEDGGEGQDDQSQSKSLPSDLPKSSQPSNKSAISIRNSLKKVRAFSHLDELRLRKIIEIGSITSLKTDEILFRENDPGDSFYIVLSGSVEVYAETLGKHLTVLKSGSFFGEISLMLGIPRTATISAMEPTVLFEIVQSKFKLLLQRYPDFQEAIAEDLRDHQEELRERKLELQRLGLLTKEEEGTNIATWINYRVQTIFDL